MTRSMTGFARQEQTFSWGNAIWELRSVNHRYLETSFRLPDTLRELEPKLRDAVRQALQRGKLEATLHLQLEQTSEQTIGLNMERVRQLALAGQQITAQLDQDRKSTRLNSSHVAISYAVFCLKKKIEDIYEKC